MSVYHITYISILNEICLYFDGGCNFFCHGCISIFHPNDIHLDEIHLVEAERNKTISPNEVLSYLQPLSFNKVIFLGREPTIDEDFYYLTKALRERWNTYNVLLTNGWEYVEDEIIDEVCLSIKAITPTLFENWTGKREPERVLNNFRKYACRKLKLRAETLFIPDYITMDEVENIAQFIATVDAEIPYRIDAYIPFGLKDRFRSPSKEEMEEVKAIAERYLKNVSILYQGMKVKHKVERIY